MHLVPYLSTPHLQVTGASQLAVEFVILHMLSTVKQRLDGNTMVLGKMSVNLFGFKAEHSIAMTNLMHVMEAVLNKMFVLPMTLTNLNTLKFTPRKDPATNRLITGLLQLSNGTELVLNETAMGAGTLNPEGVKNIVALGNLLRDQAVTYDFPFSPLPPFHADVPTLILSEGRSLLPTDIHVPFVAEKAPAALEVPADLLQELRIYLSVVREITVEIDQPIAEMIEKDFVAMRQANPTDVQAETLHQLLVMSRLMSQSKGEVKLSPESWRETVTLEDARLKAMPPAQAAPAKAGAAAAAPPTTATTAPVTVAAM
jgi:hypothetical protein